MIPRPMPTPLRALAIVSILLLCACGQREAAPAAVDAPPPGPAPATEVPAAPTASEPRIVFLGDSLTAGLGLRPEDAIPALIQARLDAEGYTYEVVNAGVSGDTSAGGLRRLDWSLDGDVRVLVVELGANDGLRGLPVSEMQQNLTGILQAARERGLRVLLTGMEAPPNFGPDYTSEYRQVFPGLAKRFDVAFLPFFLEGVAGKPALNQADGIHPNPDGARIVAGHVWSALRPLLEAPSSR